jgi:hypothetical protein
MLGDIPAATSPSTRASTTSPRISESS